MAANVIIYDQQHSTMRRAIRAMQLIREAAVLLDEVTLEMEQFRNGDGSDAAHYALLATEAAFEAGGYASANAAAKASYDEFSALKGAVDGIQATISQASARHGI